MQIFDDLMLDELLKTFAQIYCESADDPSLANAFKQMEKCAVEYDALNEMRIAERSFRNSCRFHVGCDRQAETKPGNMRFHTAVGGG